MITLKGILIAWSTLNVIALFLIQFREDGSELYVDILDFVLIGSGSIFTIILALIVTYIYVPFTIPVSVYQIITKDKQE
jgi:hypothetical protein